MLNRTDMAADLGEEASSAIRPGRPDNWLGLPPLRLTTLLPLALSAVVFVVTLAFSWVAADLFNRQNTQFLADKAQVFLDASAGHFVTIDSVSTAAFTEALTAALSFKTVLNEEALAVAWYNSDGVNVLAIPTNVADDLHDGLRAALATGQGSPFTMLDDERGILTAVYDDNGTRFAITGLFDTSELAAANDAVHQAALGLSLLVALAIAGASYLLARAAISPLIVVANRLAEGGTSGTLLRGGQYLSSEILEIETILALRRADDETRASMAQRLAQLERDQVLARLAATLAHEVRNPLAGIRNAFSTLRRFGDDKSVRQETLDIIGTGLDSLQRLTDVTLSTYRRKPGLGLISAADIKDLALIVSPQVKDKGLRLQWDIPQDLSILADGDAVRQMLVNLLLNACKASPEGGFVSVSAVSDMRGVSVSIGDAGPGLSESVLLHLKAGQPASVSESRDLGLWVVYSLADELGASVSIEGRAGAGTTVTLLFPNHDSDEMDAADRHD